jgi:hypothetical protein
VERVVPRYNRCFSLECIQYNLFTIPPPSPPRAPRRRGVRRRAVQVDHVFARRHVELHVERGAFCSRAPL